MNILVTHTFEAQLRDLLESMLLTETQDVQKFKMYLDTILINMPTKAAKYKISKFFDDEDVRDIEHEDFIIPFYHNKQKNTYLILGIIRR